MQRLMVRGAGHSAFNILFTVLIIVVIPATSWSSFSEGRVSPPAECVKVGNYWEYAFRYDPTDEMHYEGNITMEVADEEQRTISGNDTSVFVIDIFGDCQISGTWLDNPLTGTLHLWGEDVRLLSNLSLVSEHMFLKEYMDFGWGTSDLTSDASIAYEPVRDDVIGDTNLTIGSNFTSVSQMTIEQWVNFSGSNQTQNGQNQTSLTFTLIAEKDITVTPAGSFLCDVYLVTFRSEQNELNAMWYYSEKVGNYVKSEGAFSWIASLGTITNLELRSYSYSSDNVPPDADAGEDQTVKVGDTVTFDGSASSDNVGIVTYNWTFTDAAVVNLSGEVVYHVFQSEGVYTVYLTVSDEAGNSNWDTMNVTVKKSSSILGTNVALIGVIVAAIVIAAVAVLVLRKRKGKNAPSETSDSFVFTVPPK